MWRSIGELQSGTEITVQYTPEGFGGAAGIHLSVVDSNGSRTNLDGDADRPMQDGTLSGTVEQDYNNSPEVEIHIVVWPGDVQVWVQEVEAVMPG